MPRWRLPGRAGIYGCRCGCCRCRRPSQGRPWTWWSDGTTAGTRPTLRARRARARCASRGRRRRRRRQGSSAAAAHPLKSGGVAAVPARRHESAVRFVGSLRPTHDAARHRRCCRCFRRGAHGSHSQLACAEYIFRPGTGWAAGACHCGSACPVSPAAAYRQALLRCAPLVRAITT